MRAVVQQSEPLSFRNWKRLNTATPQNLKYNHLPGPIKDEIKQSLLQEQGYLCGYTLQRLSAISACHIEHIIPQTQSPSLALDYANMLACFPADGGARQYGFGAPLKAGTHVFLHHNFISPHYAGCEAHFCYQKTGAVTAVDTAAQETIEILRLNHPTLQEFRRSAIQTYGLSLRSRGLRSKQRPLSATAARRLAQQVLQPDAQGRLEPYCVALAQVALNYAEQEDKRSQRLRKHGS